MLRLNRTCSLIVRSACSLGAIGLPSLLTTPVLAQTAPDAATALTARLDAAFKKNDVKEVERLLRESMGTPAVGRDLCWKVMAMPRGDHRLLGAAVLADMADATSLAKAAKALHVVNNADERRILVSAIGRRAEAWKPLGDAKSRDEFKRQPGKEIAAILTDFVQDQDRMVRIAAVQAMADTGRAETIEKMLFALTLAPSQSKTWDTSDDGSLLSMSAYGAVAALTGMRPESSQQVRDWVQRHRSEMEHAADGTRPWEAAGLPKLVLRNGTLDTPSLIVRFETPAMKSPRDVKDDGTRKFAGALEQACAKARQGCEGVFGTVHLPPIQLILADDHNIASFGGTSKGYFGFALGNQVVMRVGPLQSMQSTMAHEFVHIIHQASYKDQPRWLSEGLAESLSKSTTASSWPKDYGGSTAGLRSRVTGGAMTAALLWTGTGSSEEPYELYQLGHLTVDYLRFGGFTIPERRLTALMGRLGRGESADRALKNVYGLSAAEMDKDIKRWLEKSE